ncbi:MAG: MFS transporter [Phycisphaerae bacterium]|nr:MFS transporter [Phycisphaerae bacterium]
MNPSATTGKSMDFGISARLSIMMFIQFFVWGAWYVTGPLFLGPLGFTGKDFGWMYSVGPIAGMISPFFVGMIADRLFSTERVLGVMHLGAAGAMIMAIRYMGVDEPDPNMINLMFFVHMLFYFPTLALTNTLALRNMSNAEKQFPLIRVFGTIGWIVAGLVISFFLWDTSITMFHLAAGAALVMGLYSFTLPHTPPVSTGKAPTAGELLGLDALVLLKRPSFAVFMASSFLICIPLAFYYQMASRVVQQADLVPGLTMSYGQMSEIFFMLVMPLFFARLGVKWMLFVGMLAWVVRYALFSLGAADQVVWMILAGVLLHGICYDFFFVTGQIYTDKAAPKEIKGQAQGMLVLFTLGLGMFIGAQIGGWTESYYTPVQTGRLYNEAGAIGAQAGAKLEELAGLMLADGEANRPRFDAYAKASRTVLPDDDASDQFIESFMDAAAKATGPIQTKIDDAYKSADDSAEKINVKLAEVTAALKQDYAGQEGSPSKVMDAVLAQLTTRAAEQTEAAMKGADAVASTLLQEKITALGDAAVKTMQSSIDKHTIDPEISGALLLQARVDALSHYQQRREIDALRVMNWTSIWMWPALGAAVIMVLFMLTFRDGSSGDDSVSEGDVAEAAAREEMP